MRQRLMMFMFGCAVVAGVSGTLRCTSAGAAATWLAPSSLSSSGGGPVGNVALAADPKGEVVSVWWREGIGVESAFRLAEAPNWSVPASVSTPGWKAETPEVGMDAQGDAVAVWQGGPEERWKPR